MPPSFVQMTTTKKDAVKNLLAPKLRFKEFKEGWSDVKMSDIITFISGFAFESSKMLTEGGKYQLIKMSNVYKSEFQLDRSPSFWDELDSRIEKVLLRRGDIILTLTGTVGKRDYGYSVVIPEDNKFLLNQRLVCLRSKPGLSDSGFINGIVKTSHFEYHFFNESKGGTGNQSNVGVEDLRNIKLTIPTLHEQQKIAAFLSAVDEKIQQLTRKKELLTQYKKGVMQQLFSSPLSELGLEGLKDDRINADQTNPSIPQSYKSQFRQFRFRQDNGKPYPKWVEKLFEEIYSFFSTNSLSRDKLNYETGSVKNIHYGDIHTKFSSQFIVNEEYVPYVNADVDLSKVKEENFCREGDLVIADASEDYNDIGKSIELVKLNSEKVIAGLHTFLARPDLSKIKIGFSGYLVQAPYVRMQVQKIAQGTKVLSLSSGRLGKVKLFIPHIEEQQKIASFLTALDAKIETVNNQITQTQTFKKGLLQQMFV